MASPVLPGGGGPPADEGPQSPVTIITDGKAPTNSMSRAAGAFKVEKGFGRANTVVRKKLRTLDTDGDGTLDEDELIRGIEEMVHEGQLREVYKYTSIGLFIVVIVLIGAIGGMTYGIVEATKETKVQGAMLVANDNPNTVVQTAIYDMAVVNGVLVSRQAAGVGSNATGAETSNKTSSAVLRAASFTTQQAFSSVVNIKALMEMKYFYVQAASGAELALAVHGVARVMQPNSVHGSVVKIVTLSGTIVLDDVMISFESDIAPIFAQAGFVVDNAGRRLLGVYDIFGFFAYIEDMTVFNLPKNEPKPALPAGDFEMSIKLWEPCSITVDGQAFERCHYDPGHVTYDNVTNANMTNGGGRHLLQGTALTDVLPGVEVMEDGLEYMSSINTVTRVGKLVRTIYEFASVPGVLKVELLNEDTKNITSWQVTNDTALPGSTAYWCQNYTLPATFFSGAARANMSGANFSFVGYVTKMGTPARHFLLTMPQPPEANGAANPPLSVDYFDAADTKYPLFFDFYHPKGGHMMIYVQSFKMLNATTRPSALEMTAPTNNVCTNNDGVLRMGSPFTVPTTQLKGSGPVAGTNSTRRLLSFDDEPGAMRATGPSGKPAYMYDPYYDAERPWLSESFNRTASRRRAVEDCAVETTLLKLPLGACDFDMFNVAPPGGIHMELACGGSLPAGSPIILKGHGDLNTCTKEMAGCISVSLGFPDAPGSKVIKKLKESFGIEDIEVLKICAGYNYGEKVGFVRGTYSGPPLWLWVFKAELSGEIRFSSCCIWIEVVQLEGFVGIDLGFWSGYTSIGTFKFVNQYYLKGSPAQAEANSNPTIINYNSDITPHTGYWGGWTDNSYCYSESPAGSGKAEGIPINGIQVRFEPEGGDDTALNAVRLACADGTTIASHEGWWGDWTGWRYCPGNNYVRSAQMRVESPGGDDTAANALLLKCSDGTVLGPHYGLWGDWGNWVTCPGNTFVCGLKVRIEEQQGGGDDTALNGVTLFCCNQS